MVTNGLVLNIDGGFLPSYPRSGTTIYDLGFSGSNGTLTNGPSYSGSNGGSIVLDGVNDYINIPFSGNTSNEYTFNVDDIWKRYYIRYALDFSDVHTTDEIYNIHDAEFSTEVSSFTNQDLISIKGLNEVNIPFALGSRKNELNWLEKRAKDVFSIIDAVTGVFGGGTNFASQIDARVGVLQIGQKYFSVTKFLYLGSGQKQPVNFENFISAKALWNNYHFINQIQLNDFEIRQTSRITIKPSDFVNLLNNNFAEIDGEICEILRIEWIDEKSFAEITYKKPSTWANGNVYTLTIND
jgi:hypothetical protein